MLNLSSFAIAEGQHVYYMAADQPAHQLPYYRQSWRDQDLTAARGAVAAAGSGLSSFAITLGQHVYYLAAEVVAGRQDVHQLWYDIRNGSSRT